MSFITIITNINLSFDVNNDTFMLLMLKCSTVQIIAIIDVRDLYTYS